MPEAVETPAPPKNTAFRLVFRRCRAASRELFTFSNPGFSPLEKAWLLQGRLHSDDRSISGVAGHTCAVEILDDETDCDGNAGLEETAFLENY